MLKSVEHEKKFITSRPVSVAMHMCRICLFSISSATIYLLLRKTMKRKKEMYRATPNTITDSTALAIV